MRQDDISHSLSAVHIYLLYVYQVPAHGYYIFTEIDGTWTRAMVGLKNF